MPEISCTTSAPGAPGTPRMRLAPTSPHAHLPPATRDPLPTALARTHCTEQPCRPLHPSSRPSAARTRACRGACCPVSTSHPARWAGQVALLVFPAQARQDEEDDRRDPRRARGALSPSPHVHMPAPHSSCCLPHAWARDEVGGGGEPAEQGSQRRPSARWWRCCAAGRMPAGRTASDCRSPVKLCFRLPRTACRRLVRRVRACVRRGRGWRVRRHGGPEQCDVELSTLSEPLVRI